MFLYFYEVAVRSESEITDKISCRRSPEGKLYFLDKYLTPYTNDNEMKYDKDDWKPFRLEKPEN